MKSKEDIYLEEIKKVSEIDEKFAKILLSDAIRKFTLNCLIKIQSEFIPFAEWILENKFQYCVDEQEKWVSYFGPLAYSKRITSAELYQLYLESKN